MLARNSAAAEKSEAESARTDKNFSPPNPLPFCPLERPVFCSAKGGAISRSFVQKRFELRSVIATNLNIAFCGQFICSLAPPSLSPPPNFVPVKLARHLLHPKNSLTKCAYANTVSIIRLHSISWFIVNEYSIAHISHFVFSNFNIFYQLQIFFNRFINYHINRIYYNHI